MTQGEGNRSQILLVEDNLTDATLIRSILEQDESIRVTLVQDGIRGCQLVEGQRWDLVITDINLPGRDGIQVIGECKLHQPDTPIIATAAFASPAYLEAAIRTGAREVLTKPIHRDELVSTVRNLLILKDTIKAQPRQILAMGALPGDVEAGCGGTLIKHAHAGHQVSILVLAIGATGEDGSNRREAAQRAARSMGARLRLPERNYSDIADLDQMVLGIQNAVHEMKPDIVFAPSPRDIRDSRGNAFRATDISARKVSGFYCYQAATTTLDFRPTMFEDISEYLDQKMAVLSHFEAQVRGRPHLDPELARASARYWGRFLGYGEVEPLEVVRHAL